MCAQVEIGARSHLYLFSVHWFIRRFVIACAESIINQLLRPYRLANPPALSSIVRQDFFYLVAPCIVGLRHGQECPEAAHIRTIHGSIFSFPLSAHWPRLVPTPL